MVRWNKSCRYLKNQCLKTALQEVLDFQTKDIIEFHLILWEDTDADETSEKGVTLEETLGVLVLQSQKGTGNLSDLGDGELDAPDFTLVAEIQIFIKVFELTSNLPETELTNEFQLLVETGFLVTTRWGDIGLGADH